MAVLHAVLEAVLDRLDVDAGEGVIEVVVVVPAHAEEDADRGLALARRANGGGSEALWAEAGAAATRTGRTRREAGRIARAAGHADGTRVEGARQEALPGASGPVTRDRGRRTGEAARRLVRFPGAARARTWPQRSRPSAQVNARGARSGPGTGPAPSVESSIWQRFGFGTTPARSRPTGRRDTRRKSPEFRVVHHHLKTAEPRRRAGGRLPGLEAKYAPGGEPSGRARARAACGDHAGTAAAPGASSPAEPCGRARVRPRSSTNAGTAHFSLHAPGARATRCARPG